jgi:hypothetical protein
VKRLAKSTILILLIFTSFTACEPISEEVIAVGDIHELEAEGVVEDPTTTTEEIVVIPTPTPDISKWIVKVGDIECGLEALGEDYPGWYKVFCTENVWLPIGQTTAIEVTASTGVCALIPTDILEEIIQEYLPDALQFEFVQMDDGRLGCHVPFSDTAGVKVVCGFECGGEEIGIILNGKTIRNFSRGSTGSSGNSSGSGQQPPPQPTSDPE